MPEPTLEGTVTGNSKQENEETKQKYPPYPEGKWVRKTSYARGDYLKMEDEMMTTFRGGIAFQIIKNITHHVPVIPIGDLDDYGKELLDFMLEGNDSINEIVEFFKDYKPSGLKNFNKKKFKEAQEAKIEEEEIETEIESEDEDDEEHVSDEDTEEEVPQTEVASEPKKEKKKKKTKTKKEKKTIPPNPDYVFDLNDPDFEKIPFMHPDTKTHTFEEWFEILYSICDPKGLTDEQCIDVMEIRMGGSYLKELKDMKTKKYVLCRIEEHFLRKDIKDPGYIFNLNDPDFMKIPFKHPDRPKHTFEEWFQILYSVCDPKGLTDKQCVDVMEIRMGGTYLTELKEMKAKHWELEAIELHFLKKDMEGDEEDDGRPDKQLQIVRSSCNDKWGVHMSYSKSSDAGLHLVIDHIKENSPAWKSGLRAMDCIVSVHGWLITLMDRAEVALSLFQACGNVAVLSILKSHGVNEDLNSMCWV